MRSHMSVFSSYEPIAEIINMKCQHEKQDFWERNILLVVIVIFGVFVLRELVCWYFKTNHILSTVQNNQRLLQQILSMVVVDTL